MTRHAAFLHIQHTLDLLHRLPASLGRDQFFEAHSCAHFLENGVVQGQIGHQLLQLQIFLFQFFEFLGLGLVQSPIFIFPAVVSLFADGQLFGGLGHGHALAEKDFSLSQFGDDILR